MRTSPIWFAVFVVLVGGLASCTLNGDQAADPIVDVETLQAELSDSQRTVLEQQVELDELHVKIETQQAIEDALGDGLAEAGRRAQEAQSSAALAVKNNESLINLICVSTEAELPTDVPEALVRWLIETESANGEVPADMQATIIDAAGRDGSWVLIAEFDTRLEPGLFLTDSDGIFTALWGGLALSESDMWDYITETFPDDDISMAACIDLGYFIETNA